MRVPRAAVSLLLGALICVLTVRAPEGSNEPERWVFPGEFESHQAMWMNWPVFEYKAGFSAIEPMTEMIRALRGRTHVNLAVQDDADELSAREALTSGGVSLEHVHFFHIPHGDIWARDTGPQFTRSVHGRLRINDWNFNMWGHEEPDSELSLFEEPFDRNVASLIDVPSIDARAGRTTGVRFIHEGGSATHNGKGTMIAVESVVIQRNLGPGRFCGGQAPVTDYDRPNTYAPNPDWPACKLRVEQEYRRMLGATKIIWIPTGVIEDNGTFRGALGSHIHVPELDGVPIPHAGVYTVFTTNGHIDEVARFVAPDRVVLAWEEGPSGPARTPVERLQRWMQEQNRVRLARVYDILSRSTTESGRPIEIIRMPTPVLVFDVFQPGDGTYDYFAAYDRWEDGTVLTGTMMGVWAASYVNYVPTNGVVLVSKFWKPGRPLEMKRRDAEALAVLRRAFPGREVVQIYAENVNRGGGGMNCITQQQPASARFARLCGWAKVQVGVGAAPLYAGPAGDVVLGSVPRLGHGGPVSLQRLPWGSTDDRIHVRVVGPSRLNGETGWIDAELVESAGEMCPAAYSRN
jgi:agmatine deiminase